MILPQRELDALIEKFMASFADKDKAVRKKLEKKTLDPFIFALEFSETGKHSWQESAMIQGLRKARESAIGDLHEDLFGLLPGWVVMPRQHAEPDLVCEGKKIIVEMKSRQDTVKGSSQKDVYDDLLSNVNGRYRGYQGLYCYWLNKTQKALDAPLPFTPPDNTTKQNRPVDSRLMQVDGRLMWAIATRPATGIEGPYDNLDTIFEVYKQVFQTIERFSKVGLTDEAQATLETLSRKNFGL